MTCPERSPGREERDAAIEEYVRRLVAETPPLSDAVCAKIAAIWADDDPPPKRVLSPGDVA